jgi:ribosomal protein S27AE
MEEFQKVEVNRVTGKQLRLCTNCGDAMIAAKSSKYVSERCVPQIHLPSAA